MAEGTEDLAGRASEDLARQVERRELEGAERAVLFARQGTHLCVEVGTQLFECGEAPIEQFRDPSLESGDHGPRRLTRDVLARRALAVSGAIFRVVEHDQHAVADAPLRERMPEREAERNGDAEDLGSLDVQHGTSSRNALMSSTSSTVSSNWIECVACS